jgi:tRNA pseudouridine38-40 synthase
MRNIKLTIEFDGTNYCGWQKQKNALSVQETIENSIEKLVNKKTKINSSGRTDSGVHAKNMVANFFTESKIPDNRFSDALNSVLPNDIIVKNSKEVKEDFHARFSAKGKCYKYIIYNSEFPTALERNRVCHIRNILDLDLLIKAANYFVGTHDFSAFTSSGTNVKNFTRTVYSFKITKVDKYIYFEIKGNGFLYNMVRIIVGTLVEVGNKKIDPKEIENIILSKDRKKAGKTIAPQGLYLEEVYY